MKRGSHMSRFEILGDLGAGGMGTVLRAFDPELKRVVAIKILGRADGPSAAAADRTLVLATTGGTEDFSTRGDLPLGSLRDEARSMAQLTHPNVVRVYEVGVAGGELFIVMELVDGQTLAQWLESDRSTDEILDVFRQAALGLAAAHEVGIVHRDFKPSNVLVGDDGIVRVADFGLATASGSSPSASAATMGARRAVGTPGYMGPEVRSARAPTPLTDVYAFGASLLEALGGELPRAGSSAAEATSTIPSSRRLPRQLEATLRRCLSPVPDDRPPARQLANSLANRSPRRRLLLGAVVGVALAASAGALFFSTRERGDACADWPRLTSSWDPSRADAVAVALAVTKGPLAVDTSPRVVAALDARAKRLAELHAELCRARAAAALDPPTFAARSDCLAEALASFDATVALLSGPIAAPSLERAVALASRRSESDCALLRAHPSAASAGEREDVRLARADFARLAASIELGEQPMVQQLERLRALAERAEALEAPDLAARVLLREGLSLREANRDEAAIATLRAAVLTAAEAGNPRLEAAATIELARVVAVLRNRADEGATLLDVARAAVAHAGDADLAAHLELVSAAAARLQSRYDDADRHIEEAARLLENNGVVSADLDDLLSSERRAVVMMRQKHARGYELYRAAALDYVERLGPSHPKVAATNATVGYLLVRLGRAEEALAVFDKVIAAYAAHPHLDRERLEAIYRKAFALEVLGRNREARALHEQVLAARERGPPPQQQMVAASHQSIAQASLFSDSLEAALAHYEAALSWQREHRGDDHLETASSLEGLGYCHLVLGKFASARAYLDEARQIRARSLGVDHPLTIEIDELIAWQMIESGKSRAASTLLDERLAALRRDPDHDVEAVGRMQVLAGRALLAQGKHEAARAVLESSLASLSTSSDPAEPALARFFLARAISGGGDRARGIALAREALPSVSESSTWRRRRADEIRRWLADNPL